MKRRSLVFVVVGTLVALALLAVVLAFTPGVQTWAARRVLAGLPEGQASVDRVAAGLTSVEITGLRISQPEFSARVARFSVRYSAMDLLRTRTVDLADLVVEGVELDLRGEPGRQETAASRQPSSTPVPPGSPSVQEPVESTPFRGVLEEAKLPDGIRIARLRIDGAVLLPEMQSAVFNLAGEGIAWGSDARLTWSVEMIDQSPEAAIRAVRSQGEATAAITADGRIERVKANVVAGFEGQDLPADRLRLELALARTGAGNETYEIGVARVVAAGTDPLFSAQGAFDSTSSNLAGTWRATLAGPSVAALLSGLNLPELSLDGEGTFTWNARGDTFGTTGRAQGQVAQLTALSSALEAVGAVRFQTDFEVAGDPESLRLARFNLDVATTEGTQLARVETLQAVTLALATQEIGFATPGAELARVALRSVPLAWAQPFVAPLRIEGGDVSLTFAIEAVSDGSRVNVRSVDPLRVSGLTVRDEETMLAENVTLEVYPTINYDAGRIRAELSRLTVSLGAGDAVSGTLQVDVAEAFTQPAVTFSGDLTGRLVSLHTPHVPVETGPLGFAASFAGSHAENVLDLARGTVTVNGNADALLGEASLRSPLQFNLETGALTGTPALSAGVRLGVIPLAWAKPFLDGMDLAGEVTGGAVELVMASPTELTVNTVAPLTLRGAGLTMGEEVMARDLDLSIDASATLRGDNVTYDVRQLLAAQAGATVAAVKAAGGLTLGEETFRLTTRGTLEADAAAALRQPVLAPYATLARGRVGASFEATVGEAIEAKSVVTLRQLVARAENKALGDVDATLSLTTKAGGSGTVELPLKVVAGNRTSDLVVKGAFTQSEQAITFNGTVTGAQVIVDDLQAFAVLAPAGTAPASAPVARDTKPFWSGVGGRIEANLKKVHYGADTVINDLRGVIALSETRMALETFEGKMKEDPFKFVGGVNFDARQPKPYTLAGTINLSNLDLGAILAAANPKEKPTVETKVTAAGTLAGQGATLDDLLQRLQGTFDVKGSGGVLRALGRRGEAVGAVSGLLGLAGALRGSESTVATAELASQLNELRFDSMAMKVERGADLNLKLVSMEFFSPTMRLTGSGTVRYQEGVPLTRQAMNLQFSLAGKGALSQVLDRVGLLSGQQDDRQYFTMRQPITISGTPMSTDTRDLWSTILQTALRTEVERRNAAAARRSQQAEGQAPQNPQGTAPSQGTQTR